MSFIMFIAACLAQQPSHCVEDWIALQEVTNATACHLVGQIEVQEWLSEHPGMEVREAKCMARATKPASAATAGRSE